MTSGYKLDLRSEFYRDTSAKKTNTAMSKNTYPRINNSVYRDITPERDSFPSYTERVSPNRAYAANRVSYDTESNIKIYRQVCCPNCRYPFQATFGITPQQYTRLQDSVKVVSTYKDIQIQTELLMSQLAESLIASRDSSNKLVSVPKTAADENSHEKERRKVTASSPQIDSRMKSSIKQSEGKMDGKAAAKVAKYVYEQNLLLQVLSRSVQLPYYEEHKKFGVLTKKEVEFVPAHLKYVFQSRPT